MISLMRSDIIERHIDQHKWFHLIANKDQLLLISLKNTVYHEEFTARECAKTVSTVNWRRGINPSELTERCIAETSVLC